MKHRWSIAYERGASIHQIARNSRTTDHKVRLQLTKDKVLIRYRPGQFKEGEWRRIEETEPLASDIAARRDAAEQGSRALAVAIQRYIEKYAPGVRP